MDYSGGIGEAGWGGGVNVLTFLDIISPHK